MSRSNCHCLLMLQICAGPSGLNQSLNAEMLQASDNLISALLPPTGQPLAAGGQSVARMLRSVGRGKPPTPQGERKE